MKTSVLHIAAAVAMMTTAHVSFAQQTSDANAPGTSGSSDAIMRADTSAADTMPARQGHDMNRNCAGLSDRQTESACKQGYPIDHANSGMGGREIGGRTDDQVN